MKLMKNRSHVYAHLEKIRSQEGKLVLLTIFSNGRRDENAILGRIHHIEELHHSKVYIDEALAIYAPFRRLGTYFPHCTSPKNKASPASYALTHVNKIYLGKREIKMHLASLWHGQGKLYLPYLESIKEQ